MTHDEHEPVGGFGQGAGTHAVDTCARCAHRFPHQPDDDSVARLCEPCRGELWRSEHQLPVGT
jgi:hypothetical protein